MARWGGHNRLGRLARDQRGQTTIFVALSMMVLICFAAFVVNVGQIIHDRVLMQSAADLIALSAANVQAAGLNEVADLNLEIDKLKQDMLMDIGFAWRIWASKGQAEKCIEYYTSWMGYCAEEQEKAMKKFASGARKVAKQIHRRWNQRYGTGGSQNPHGPPGRSPIQMQELIHGQYPGYMLSDLAGRRMTVYYMYFKPMAKSPIWTIWFWLGGKKPMRYGRHRMMSTQAMGIILMGSKSIYWKSYKDPTKVAYYRVLLRRGPVKPYMNLPDYGFDVKIPAIQALALAQPTRGDIDRLKPKYVARFMPLRTTYDYDVSFPYRDKYRH